jgi:hypothetical protein
MIVTKINVDTRTKVVKAVFVIVAPTLRVITIKTSMTDNHIFAKKVRCIHKSQQGLAQ